MAFHSRLSGLCLPALVAVTVGLTVRDAGTDAAAREAAAQCKYSPDWPLPPTRDPRLQQIHVGYSSNLGISSTGLLTSMVTMASHLSDPWHCTIHLIVSKDKMEEARGLVAHYERELVALPAIPQVVIHEMFPLKFNISELNAGADDTDLPRYRLLHPETFVRLRLTEYLPDVHRVLWLDHDTLIKADIGPLYHMDMKHAMAAVGEFCLGFCPVVMYAKRRGLEEIKRLGEYFDPYTPAFDSGIVLLDLDRWRLERLPERVEHWVKVTMGFEGDQAALNVVFRGILGIDILDWRWNNQPHGFHTLKNISWPQDCVDQAKIIHFSGAYKPWADCDAYNVTEKDSDPSCRSPFNWRINEIFKPYAVYHP